ncbi:MAG: LPXTG cell wall anchor domain-containing protein [Clostridiales bacterium]
MLKKTLSTLLVLLMLSVSTLMANACTEFSSKSIKNSTCNTHTSFSRENSCEKNYNCSSSHSFDFNNASCFNFGNKFNYSKDFKLFFSKSYGISKYFKWEKSWSSIVQQNLEINKSFSFKLDYSSLDVYKNCTTYENYFGSITIIKNNIQYSWDLKSNTLVIVDKNNTSNCIKLDLNKCSYNVNSTGLVNIDMSNLNSETINNNNNNNNNKDSSVECNETNKSEDETTSTPVKDETPVKTTASTSDTDESTIVQTEEPVETSTPVNTDDETLPKTGEGSSLTFILSGLLLVIAGMLVYIKKRVSLNNK